MPFGRGKPVGFHVGARSLCPGVKRQRSIRIPLQALGLRSERVTLQIVRMEQMLLVVKRERPEPVDRGLFALWKRDRIGGFPIEYRAGRIFVGIEILRLIRLVIEHVRLRRPRTIEVVDPPLRVVRGSIPAVTRWASVML